MTNDLVERLRRNATYRDKDWQCIARPSELNEAADRIEELERHVELRDWFLVENDLWERFAKGAEGKK